MSHTDEGGDTLSQGGFKDSLSHEEDVSDQLTPMSPGASRGRVGSLPSFGESDDDFGMFSFGGIEKSVESDATDEEVVTMLQNARASCEALETFNEEDLRRLAPVLTVMRFADGDAVIKKGEKATFAAIVLEGSFLVKVSEGLQFDCLCGETLGEMSYFEGGKRTADVTSNGGAILGILLFEHIDQLKLYEPDLYSRVIQLQTMAAVSRLRNTINSLESYKHEAKKRIGDYEELLIGTASGTVRLQVQQQSLYRISNSNEKTQVETGEVVGKSMLRDKVQKTKQDEAIAINSPRMQSVSETEQHSESLFQNRGGRKATMKKPSEKVIKHNNAAVAINACTTIDSVTSQHAGVSLPNVQTAKKSITHLLSHMGELKKRLQAIAKADNEQRGHNQQVLKELQDVRAEKDAKERQYDALVMQMEQKQHVFGLERKSLNDTINEQASVIGLLQNDSSTLASDVHSQSTTLTQEKLKYQNLEQASKKIFDRMYFKMLRYAAESKQRGDDQESVRQKYHKVERQHEQLSEQCDRLGEKQGADDRRITSLITQNRSLRAKYSTMTGLYSAFKWKAYNLQKILFYSTSSAFSKLSMGKRRLYQLYSATRQRADQLQLDLSQHAMTFQVYLHVQDEILVRDQDDALSVRSNTSKLINAFKTKSFTERVYLVLDASERLDGLTKAYINTLVEIAERSKARLNAAMLDHEQLRATSAENMNLKSKIRVLERSLETYTSAESSERSSRDSQLQAFHSELAQQKREQKRLSKDNSFLTQKRDKLVHSVRKYSAQARVFVTQCAWTLQQHDLNLARAELTKVVNELKSLGHEEAAKQKQRELDSMPIPEVPLPLSMPSAPHIDVEDDPLEGSSTMTTTTTHSQTTSSLELPSIKSQGGGTPTIDGRSTNKQQPLLLTSTTTNTIPKRTATTNTHKLYTDISSVVKNSLKTRDVHVQDRKRRSPYEYKGEK